MFEIPLNSFVRRINKPDILKAVIKNSGARLTRVGRSRNWKISADLTQVEAILHQAQAEEEPSWQWFITQLSQYKPQLTVIDLVNIIKNEPLITLNQLMAKTDCSTSDARAAMDKVEWD